MRRGRRGAGEVCELVRFVPHAEQDVREMLAAGGVAALDDLFQSIPREVRCDGRLSLPEPAAEADVVR